MPQFGAATTITTRTRLILLDCFETLVELDGAAYRPRKGVIDFLAWFRDRQPTKLAVISDAEQDLVEAALGQAGLSGYLLAVYHAGNALERLPEGRSRKRLDVPLTQLGVGAAQTIFIGDSPLDGEAAAHYQVPFIRVPRSEDRAFSFATLISGPSRYNSQEFSVTFLDQYLKKPGDR
jgi:phosphoglycolate phosphatase-like HAD superfamily hydrolase